MTFSKNPSGGNRRFGRRRIGSFLFLCCMAGGVSGIYFWTRGTKSHSDGIETPSGSVTETLQCRRFAVDLLRDELGIQVSSDSIDSEVKVGTDLNTKPGESDLLVSCQLDNLGFRWAENRLFGEFEGDWFRGQTLKFLKTDNDRIEYLINCGSEGELALNRTVRDSLVEWKWSGTDLDIDCFFGVETLYPKVSGFRFDFNGYGRIDPTHIFLDGVTKVERISLTLVSKIHLFAETIHLDHRHGQLNLREPVTFENDSRLKSENVGDSAIGPFFLQLNGGFQVHDSLLISRLRGRIKLTELDGKISDKRVSEFLGLLRDLNLDSDQKSALESVFRIDDRIDSVRISSSLVH